jgi:uncharacterized repeat protein (TIGR03803 family)
MTRKTPAHNILALHCATLIFLIITCMPAKAQSFVTLFSFNSTDGANPFYGVIMDAKGNLYGTTVNGGAYGDGTVYKLDPSGNETILHSFAGGSDGLWPYGGVIMDAAGNLYGSTHSGGAYGDGTVYKLDPSGNETVLFGFNGTDGSVPLGSLSMDTAGNLYGTTYVGGAYDSGTVFKVDPSGNGGVLYNFTGGSDGGGPYSGVILDSAGNLYGTTSLGGANCGTLFKVDSAGSETVLFTFNGADGCTPYGGLIMDAAGNLYGTTASGGGSYWCSAPGCGTVFKLDPSGNETVLYIFGVNGGDLPLAGLIRDAAGNLYGTTATGPVFKLDTSGQETVLYNLAGYYLSYSYGPLLLDKAGNLYGTSGWGGSSNCFNGCGTVFEISCASGKCPTTTTLASNLNPSIYGQSVKFSATVTTTESMPPTGSVVFRWNDLGETLTLGTAPVKTGGVATITVSDFNADTFPIVATYSGDSNNLGSTSSLLNQVVNQTSTTATLTSSPNPSNLGEAVNFTATITSPTVTAKGPVTFTARNKVLGTVELSNGKATLTTSSLPSGSTRVAVTYNGDSDIQAASASVIQVVQGSD